jgi:Fe-S cluster biogenesis protein NfuA
MTRVEQVGDQIEDLLARLRSEGPRPADDGEALVRLLVGLYGDGLTRIVAALRADVEAGAAILAGLTADPLVESLLLLHGLHPLDVDARIQRALERIRPYLGSHAGGVRYLGVTDGVARLRLEGSCHGCPSSAVTVRLAIEGAVTEAAPEVSEVVVEGMTEPAEPALLQIGPRPSSAKDSRNGVPQAQASAAGLAGEGADTASAQATWVVLPDLGPPTSRPVLTSAAGTEVLVCAVRGTLYAYRDACAACGSSLAEGSLDREVLTCRCGARYDVSRAGTGIGGGPASHLDPLPLLADSQGVRVAVPAVVRS